MMWAVNHGNPTCPAPIKSWEKLHPGWTTKRDLIAEMADALGKRGMRLMLYMNPPGVGGMALNPGTVNGIPGYNEDEYANQLIAVFRDFGDRKSVVSGESVSVRVDLGGRRLIKNKKSK